MNSPENSPGTKAPEESKELNYSALYAHGLLDDVLSDDNGTVDIFERQLFPGFIDERETEFVCANHVRFIRNGDSFFALFEDAENDEFYQRNAYSISPNSIVVLHDTKVYDAEEKTTIAHYKQVFKNWAVTLNAEAAHSFHSVDEANRMTRDLIAYERMKQEQDRYFVLMTGPNFTDDDIRHGQDAGKQYEKIRKDINSLGVSADSNLGTRYENSYRDLLRASMKSIDLIKRVRQKSDAELYDRLVEGTIGIGVPIGGFESSSLIRVIEKVRTLPSQDQKLSTPSLDKQRCLLYNF